VRRGFSLIEMLVATVLITLLVGVALFSFRLQLITLAKTNKEQLKEVLRYTHLRQTIESMKFYVLQEYDMLNQPIKSFHYYFDGDEKSIQFITTNPIFSNEPAVVRLLCEDDTLTYQEEPLYKRIDFLRPTLLEDSQKQVLYSDLKECRFGYKTQGGKFIEVLQGKIPKYVTITLVDNYKHNNFFIAIKSDNNSTLYRVMDAIYDEF